MIREASGERFIAGEDIRELRVFDPGRRVHGGLLWTLIGAGAGAAPGRFADGSVRLGLSESENGLELRLGPMDKGAAAKIRGDLRVPELGGSLEALADELAVDESNDGEYLIVRFAGIPAA